MNARLIVGSLLLAASSALYAQAPAQTARPPGNREEMRSCDKEPDRAKCEARRKEIREHMKTARDACQSKQGRERGTCIAQHMCAKAPDPGACQARAKERMQRREEMREKGGKPPKA